MSTVWLMAAALLLDQLLGEPRRWHPLVGFGRWVQAIERQLYADRRLSGLLAWTLAVLPITLASWALIALAARCSVWAGWALQVLLLYLTIGLRSLAQHAAPIIRALRAGDVAQARHAVSMVVSRDTAALDPRQVAVAATESMLENGSDAVFAALFWFVLLGAPGAVAYRLANTLDAMWGYRTPRYRRFGWAAARIDDLLNYLPARLVALSYALCGRARQALACWRRQAGRWESPNAGPVMAAGAGALAVRLGGGAPYHGQWKHRPRLGLGRAASADSVEAAMGLVHRGVVLWWLLLWCVAWLSGVG
ncbi:adenosylcobinamide-phosphate synthase CbiB [Frateuria aurantia]